MKRYKKLVIGGIQSKIFILILYTVALLTVSYMLLSMYHNRMLSNLATDSSTRQQEAITDITNAVMDEVITRTLTRSNRMEASIANSMFEDSRNRVAFLAGCVETLFAYAEEYEGKPYGPPEMADDGVWTAKVIFADGVDASDPAITAKASLLANISDIMIALCPSLGTADAYVALPEGVFLCVDDTAASWFEDGKIISYDARERNWYLQAAETGGLVFTEGEWDANTGAYCIECAMPVYGPDGSLQAVVGTDLYLDKMQAAMRGSAMEGEYSLLLNQSGHAVLMPQAEAFPMAEADRTGDLRESSNAFLAGAIRSVLQGEDIGISMGELEGSTYYLTGTSIETTGWVLISAFDHGISSQPTTILTGKFVEIQSEASEDYLKKMAGIKKEATLILLVVMVLTLTGALVLGKRIAKPLNTITRRISELSDSNLEFKMEKAYRTHDEVEELAESFAALSHKTVEYMERIVKVTAEKERIGAELGLATKIQAAMLPHIFPAFPDRPDFDIYASMNPAKEVGGDFYDYFLIDEDHLGMVIADVSGKGVPAALFMMASKIILQSVAMLGKSAGEILTKTNEAICSNNEAQMFVTVWIGILELSTGKLTCANAGHEYPVLKRASGLFELYKDKHGFVIGGIDGIKYKEYVIQLSPGDKLFVYTDGVPEATNAEKELFGTERLVDALNTHPEAVPQDVLKNVRAAVDVFVKDAEQFDDLTMLCLEYKGPGAFEGNPQEGGSSSN